MDKGHLNGKTFESDLLEMSCTSSSLIKTRAYSKVDFFNSPKDGESSSIKVANTSLLVFC